MDIGRFGLNKPLAIYNDIDKLSLKDNPYYESSVIPPPKKDSINRVDKYYRYVIDSRDRNTQLYPSPSKYTVELDEDITDVNSVELLVVDVPFSRYLVHENNNVLHFESNGGIVDEIVIEPGDYSEEELAVEMSNRFTEKTHPINVLYNNSRKKYTFTHSSNSFKFLFRGNPYQHTNNNNDYKYKKNTIAKLLGFRNEDVEAQYNNNTNIWEAISPFTKNLTPDNYIVLKIKDVTLNKSQAMTTHSSFCVVNNPSNKISNYSDHVLKKNLSPVIQSMKKISISFYDYDGNLYNFQNHDHRLELV